MGAKNAEFVGTRGQWNGPTDLCTGLLGCVDDVESRFVKKLVVVSSESDPNFGIDHHVSITHLFDDF